MKKNDELINVDFFLSDLIFDEDLEKECWESIIDDIEPCESFLEENHKSVYDRELEAYRNEYANYIDFDWCDSLKDFQYAEEQLADALCNN